MKLRTILFAATMVCLAACSEKEEAENVSSTAFHKGQKVILSVNAGEKTTRVVGTDEGEDITFTWEAGDGILVKVGDKSAVFTLTSGAGTSSASFEGTMPDDGNTYDLEYPTQTPDLSSQTYNGSKLPSGKMSFAATGCKLTDTSITLSATKSIMKLNLYGTDITTKKIVVRQIGDNKDANECYPIANSYTLNCSDGVSLGTTSDAATPFYLVVPTGSCQFFVEVYDASNVISVFATTGSQTFSTTQALSMPALEVKKDYANLGLSVNWANWNVGATNMLEIGDLYSWGETSPHYTSLDASGQPEGWKEGKTGYFWVQYKWCNGTNNTLTKYCVNPGTSAGGITDNKETLDSEDDAAYVNFQPVNTWRMPTADEFTELLTNCQSLKTYVNGVVGCLFTSQVDGYKGYSIFLPATGVIYDSLNREQPTICWYWSSSLYPHNNVDYDAAVFVSKATDVAYINRRDGLGVRPVRAK